MAILLRDIEERLLPLEIYEGYVSQPLDLLLWKPTNIVGHFLAAGTKGPFCHFSHYDYSHGHTWSMEYSEGIGCGHMVRLSGEVRRYPGKISVFRVSKKLRYHYPSVRETLLNNFDEDYSYSILGTFLGSILPILRWMPHNWLGLTEEIANQSHKFVCSTWGSVSWAEHGVFFSNKPPALVSPNDISRSNYIDYIGTLVP